MVVALAVEADHAGEVEDVGLVHVLDVDGLAEMGRVGRHRRQVLVAAGVEQRNAGRADRIAVDAALADTERVVPQDMEVERPLVGAGAVQGAAVGIGHAFGDDQYALEQSVGIVGAAQLHAEFGQLVEALGNLRLIQLLHD